MANNISSEEEGKDMISDLPATILHQILSFLDLKQAITSSVLSTKWRYVWASLPCLKFDVTSFKDTLKSGKVKAFKRFMNQVYNLRDSSSSIQILSLSCYGLQIPTDLYGIHRCFGKWVRTSLKHNLQELYINVSIVDWRFPLPCNLFTCNSLTRLELEASFDSFYSFSLDKFDSFSLPRLKTLLLRRFQFERHDTLDNLFSGCPVLESLTITICIFNQRELKITAPKLEHLVIDFYVYEMEGMKIKLNTPNLVSIRCKDYISRDYCVENGLSSLVKAELDFIPGYEEIRGGLRVYEDKMLQTHVVRMMRSLREFHNVETLTLSASVFESFHQDPLKVQNIFKSTRVRFCKLRCLKLKTLGTCTSFLVIMYLLWSSPNTESLVMEINEDTYVKSSPYWYEVDMTKFSWKNDERSVGWEMHRLRLVEIRGVQGSIDELQFLRHLMDYGMVLEKLTLYPSEECLRYSSRRLNSFAEELFTFPRASSTVEILVLF